jgi:hypothetical protein
MHKYFLIFLIFILHPSSVLAEPHFVGYFEAKPDFGGAVNRICIKQLPDNYLDVVIATTYCPSKYCMNARLDGLWFQSQLNAKTITYSSPNCKLKMLFTKSGAKITHSATCRDEDHPYLYANGSYKYIQPEFSQDGCEP